MEYNFRDIEKRWQQEWVKNKTYHVVEDKQKQKFYVLNMFPYPLVQGYTWVIPWAILPVIFMLDINVNKDLMC